VLATATAMVNLFPASRLQWELARAGDGEREQIGLIVAMLWVSHTLRTADGTTMFNLTVRITGTI
jgi:hypothetical protein